MPRTGFVVPTLLALLAACGSDSASGGNSAAEHIPYVTPSPTPSTAQLANPSTDDARRAADVALQRMATPTVMAGPRGAPTECAGGMMNGQLVLSCKVCATIINAPPEVRSAYDVSIRMVNFLIPFKRAIGYDQPDVAPLDGAPGVWVANYPPLDPSPFATRSNPPMEVVREAYFVPDDFQKVGYIQLENGNFRPMHHQGYPIQHTALNGQRNIVAALGDNAHALMLERVGLCDGTKPRPPKSAPLE